MIRSTKDTPSKTSVITHLFRTDCSLQLETLILSMKANANRNILKYRFFLEQIILNETG